MFPGAEASAYILPSFTVSYAVLGLALTVGRLEYARSQLIAGFVLSVLWFYIVQAVVQWRQRLVIGFLPFGVINTLPSLRRVDWVPLSLEGYDLSRLNAVAADLRVDLPDAWERKLTDFALAGVPVFHIKHLMESLTGRVELEHLSENSFGTLVPNSSYLIVKQAADWLVALIALILLSPVFLLIAVGIRATSPGPALFCQRRIGFQGRPFTVYKFRTMRVPSEITSCERTAAMTQDSDARVTRFGRLLRHTRLDELPQILNILRGEMSWIGPRPEVDVLSHWYEQKIPFYRYRHVVRPGISGWAQVMQGHVAEIEHVRSKLHYDFYYIKHFSPWIDVLIVVRTLRTMMTGFGSR
jgi:lipopolysaccharide/colanic/teichoic acid biosynthesis glycosyltransferase